MLPHELSPVGRFAAEYLWHADTALYFLSGLALSLTRCCCHPFHSYAGIAFTEQCIALTRNKSFDKAIEWYHKVASQPLLPAYLVVSGQERCKSLKSDCAAVKNHKEQLRSIP